MARLDKKLTNQHFFHLPKMKWPVDWGKEHELYFYLESVEELRGGRVLVKDRGEMIMLGSYSYLCLLGHLRIDAAAKEAIDKYTTGTHGVRLLSGTLKIHNELEKRIAQFKDAEAVIVFSSGYIANLSTISSLVSHKDLVICDKFNHASIIDGCRLSGAEFKFFRHNDMDHLKQILSQADKNANKLVTVDAVFSMDGDIVNLPEVSRLCKEYGALLMVDEAHSIGVLGETGHGIEEHFGLSSNSVDVKMGTLSKTIPSIGGYIAGSRELIELLKHQAHSFIYSAALPPPQTAAALAAFDVIENEPDRIRTLHHNVFYFRSCLQELGFNTLNSKTAITPVICGENENAWLMAKLCQDKGIFIQAIPWPVVPRGTARLRCIVTSCHTNEDINYCIKVIEQAGRSIGIIS